MTLTTHRAPGSATERIRRLVLIATILGSTMGFLDATVVNVALPVIGRSLGVGLTGQQWISVSYTVSLVALYLLAGALGDRVGLARVFVWGCAAFAAASLVAGLSPNDDVLIGMRVVQGAAAAFLTSSSLALLRVVWAEASGQAIGLWTSGTSVAMVIGPFAGGAIAQYIDWRLIFFVNVPIAVVAVVLIRASGILARAKTADAAGTARRGLDLLGAVLAAGWVAALSYWLVQGQSQGFRTLGWSAVAAAVLFALFAVRMTRARDPLLPLGLFAIRDFAVANLATLLIYGALTGSLFYFGLYLQSAAIGLGAAVAGLATLPISIAMITLAPHFGRLSDRIGPRLPLTIGPICMGVGMSLWLRMQHHDPWPWIEAGVVVFALGLCMLVAPITATALQAVPDGQAGVAAAVNTAISRLGGIVTIALMGLITSSRFHARSPAPRLNPFTTTHEPAAVTHAIRSAFDGAMLLAIMLVLAGALSAAIGLRGTR